MKNGFRKAATMQKAGVQSGQDDLVGTTLLETITGTVNVADPVDTGTDPVGTTDLTVSYSDEAIAELLYMLEEEKLAGDIYDAFYEMYGMKIFDNIAKSEDSHFNALVTQAENIGIDVDSFVFEEAGSFEDPELQAMYDELLAVGSESLTAALEVGVAIEEKDMIDIAAAADLVEGTTLESVYENLLAGSQSHLDAFNNVLG